MTYVILFGSTSLLATFDFFILTLSYDRSPSEMRLLLNLPALTSIIELTEADEEMLLRSFLNYGILLIPVPVLDQEHVFMLQSYNISKLEFRVLRPVKISLRKLQRENRLDNCHM